MTLDRSQCPGEASKDAAERGADIDRCARIILVSHGERARAEARNRALILTAKGDDRRAAVWRQIAAAIEERQSTEG